MVSIVSARIVFVRGKLIQLTIYHTFADLARLEQKKKEYQNEMETISKRVTASTRLRKSDVSKRRCGIPSGRASHCRISSYRLRKQEIKQMHLVGHIMQFDSFEWFLSDNSSLAFRHFQPSNFKKRTKSQKTRIYLQKSATRKEKRVFLSSKSMMIAWS